MQETISLFDDADVTFEWEALAAQAAIETRIAGAAGAEEIGVGDEARLWAASRYLVQRRDTEILAGRIFAEIDLDADDFLRQPTRCGSCGRIYL